MPTATCQFCGRRLTDETALLRHRYQAHFTGERVDDVLRQHITALNKMADADSEYQWSLESPSNRRIYLEDRERALENDIRRRRARILNGYVSFSKAESSSQGRAELGQLADDGVRLAHIRNELRRLRKRPNEDTSGRTPGVGRVG